MPEGTAAGATTQLATVTLHGESLVVASTLTHHVACWDDADKISCTAFPIGSDTPSAAFTGTGSAIAVAYGPGGLVLAYTSGSKVFAQRLDDAGNAQGTRVTLTSAASTRSQLAASSDGYVLSTLAGTSSRIYRLNKNLQPVGSSIAVAGANNGAQVAASGSKLAVLFNKSSTNQPTAYVIDEADNASAALSLDPDATSYGRMSVAAAADSFGLSWSSFKGYIGYRSLDAAGAGSDLLHAVEVGWDDNGNAIVAVDDGFLVAAFVGGMGGSPAVEMKHLQCP